LKQENPGPLVATVVSEGVLVVVVVIGVVGVGGGGGMTIIGGHIGG
jgi:hypothetical protein